MYNLIEYSYVYLKTSESLCQYYRDKQLLETSISFKFKQEITTQTGNGGTKDIEIMVPLKCPSDFWRTLEMPLINCKISLQ